MIFSVLRNGGKRCVINLYLFLCFSYSNSYFNKFCTVSDVNSLQKEPRKEDFQPSTT